jgi:hypothetical protein
VSTPRKKPAKRRCKGTNKAGARCGAAPLKGSDYCRAHDPTVPEETRFGTPEQAGVAGSSPKPARKLTSILLRKLEERAEEIVDGLLDLTQVEEPATRLRAIAEVYDRAEGKPKQATELTGRDGGAIAHTVAPDYADPKVREAADVLLGRPADSEE